MNHPLTTPFDAKLTCYASKTEYIPAGPVSPRIDPMVARLNNARRQDRPFNIITRGSMRNGTPTTPSNIEHARLGIGNSKMIATAKMCGLACTEARPSVAVFDITAGLTCPNANLCRAWVDPRTRKLVIPGTTSFVCYAASLEARYPDSYVYHSNNLKHLLRYGKDDTSWMTYQLSLALNEWIYQPRGQGKDPVQPLQYVRLHSAGDFFNEPYFTAWTNIAADNPQITFWGYTKTRFIEYDRPSNFHLTYSAGGTLDHLYMDKFPTCHVVENADAASAMGLPVACQTHDNPDDLYYIIRGESFALTVHA